MNDPIRNRFSDKNWVPYAQFEQLPEELSGNIVDCWLSDVLAPLRLPPGFIRKVIDSVNGVLPCIPAEVRKVRLLVFAAVDHPGERQTWGFFQMVKNEAARENPAVHTHEIAIYLYVEGDPGPILAAPG